MVYRSRKRRRTIMLFGATALASTSMYAGASKAQTVSQGAGTAGNQNPAVVAPHHRGKSASKKKTPTQTVKASGAEAPAGSAITTDNAANRRVIADAKAQGAAPRSREENVVVTGTLFSDPNATNASPIEHITRMDMQRRGLKTVTDVLQSLSTNGAGNLTNGWSAGGGFATGGSAPSLRGLSTDSTLTLIDGQRLAYYGLADDGERNFVDTNWIPMSIMQTVDVLEDGGSATYGADAVAGVVNMVTRKEIQGVEGNAEGGLSQRGDAGHQRLWATYGHGDLHRDGYNFYINSEYQQDDPLYYRQLQSPYNSGDLTGIGGGNANYNTLLPDGTISPFGVTPAAIVRRSDGANSGTGAWQLLNPSAGCGSFGSVVTGSVVSGDNGKSQTCTMNSQRYAQVAPDIRRINATAHLTVNVTPRSQLVAMFNYSQAMTTVTGTPTTTRTYSQAELANTLSTPIPAYLPNGQLNPNDPFAAEGKAAEVDYRFADLLPTTTEFNQNFRGSVRYAGWEPSDWGSDWHYNADFVGMATRLTQTITGVPTINSLENAITSGDYNFVDPSQNSQAVLNALAPRSVITATTSEYSGNLAANKGLFKLPGGTANLAIGANFRHEALNDPSANPLNIADPGAQYVGTINPVNAKGSRWVESGFFEVGLPFHKMVNVDVSGRYDNYNESTGNSFHHFSPKVGLQFKPTKMLTLKGTFNQGFRVPSFSETGGSNVGYVTYDPSAVTSFVNQHRSADGSANTYAQPYSIGENTSGNPNLRPETSTGFSGGPVFKPTDWLTISADYYYIRKNHYIAPNPYGVAAMATDYLEGNALPSGVTVTPDVADTQNPSGQLRPGLINLGYVNTKKLITDGFDLKIQAQKHLPGPLHDVLWVSKGEATFVHRYNIYLPASSGGGVERFAGTLGPYSAVSSSGTPRWRANWANTFMWKGLSVTPTVYYTSGYRLTADDYSGAGTSGGCANVISNSAYYPSQCHVKGFWDVDLTVNYQVNRRWNIYANVYNLLGFRAPYDFGTYGGYLYNSSWAQNGVVMRSFQFGVNVTL
ncbi:TonB-dependent receptor [Gluconobacter cerinus]|uniref:TonB-dependent receptor plug domain-containing protein n=1 Tax=Gluconobacter cerinus TaxID=38307 RepID=UPI0030A27544